MISDLGPAMDLKGFPKDPGLVIQVSSILALGRGGMAGPTVAQQDALRDLDDTIAWAGQHHQLPHEQKAAALLLQHRGSIAGYRRGAGLAGALYQALWSIHRKRETWTYLLQLSRKRRWIPTRGQEWAQIARSRTWATAWVTARLYANGIPGNARTRSRHDLPAE